jgi:hypothetical protein
VLPKKNSVLPKENSVLPSEVFGTTRKSNIS